MIGFPLSSPYVSSKFALEGLSESLAFEEEQFGINVILIEPGVVKTNLGTCFKIGTRVASNNTDSPYSEMTRKRIAGFKPRFESGSPPIEVAKVVLKVVTAENPDLCYLVGNDAFKLVEIRNNTSDKDFRKLVMESVLCTINSDHSLYLPFSFKLTYKILLLQYLKKP